jgi:hypothetical protein
MATLGAIITQAVVHHYGRDEFLQRLAHPFWFQSFGAVMGMDWHSSGITTSVIGALNHDVRAKDVFTRRLHGTLAAAAERGPADFADLLLSPGVGARTVRSLAMVAEVVHGAPYRFRDPARFSLAHGGKDRHPYSVPLKVYDETIRVMKSAVQNAKLGRGEQIGALKRLDDQARLLELTAEGPSLEHHIAQERLASPGFGGRSVLGWEQERAIKKVTGT